MATMDTASGREAGEGSTSTPSTAQSIHGKSQTFESNPNFKSTHAYQRNWLLLVPNVLLVLPFLILQYGQRQPLSPTQPFHQRIY